MENLFFGYLPQTVSIENIKNSIVSFDTNAILNIYRFKSETAKDYIRAIKIISDNIWMPYMVGLEYHCLRTTVIKQESEFLDKVSKKVDFFKNDTLGLISSKDHNSFPFDEFRKKINQYTSELSNIIDECKRSAPNLIINDPIRDEIVGLFNGKVAKPLLEKELNCIYSTAEYRFENAIPPGFKDEKNKSEEIKLYGDLIVKSKYADYIIWHELIEKSKKEKKNIIFVTDEKKDDWVHKINGYVLGPRPELITEMKVKAGTNFYIISSIDFISLINKYGEISISQSSIKDIEKSILPTWKDIVIQAFRSLSGEATLNDIYNWIEKSRPRPLTKNWKVTARKTIYYYCKDRDIFLGTEELFESIDGSTYRYLK